MGLFLCNFYTEEEELEIEFWESEEEVFLFHDRSMQRIMPWLSKRGVRRTCPHVAGACRDIYCCHGTEAVVVSADSEQGSRDTCRESKEGMMW